MFSDGGTHESPGLGSECISRDMRRPAVAVLDHDKGASVASMPARVASPGPAQPTTPPRNQTNTISSGSLDNRRRGGAMQSVNSDLRWQNSDHSGIADRATVSVISKPSSTMSRPKQTASSQPKNRSRVATGTRPAAENRATSTTTQPFTSSAVLTPRRPPLVVKSNSPVSVASDLGSSSVAGLPPIPRKPLSEKQKRRKRKEMDRIAWLCRQKDYWHSIVLKRCVQRGPSHVCTADALIHLGDAQMALEAFVDAVKSFSSAKNIYKDTFDSPDLHNARVLDKLGHAMCKARTDVVKALKHLVEALNIRCKILGHTHVDSIDSLNHIAGVRMQLKHYHHAANDYHAVLCWREQIFGRAHTSVAITAMNLANVLLHGLGRPDQARTFYRIAQDSYEQLGMAPNEPAMKEIRQLLATTYTSPGSSVCDGSLANIREHGAVKKLAGDDDSFGGSCADYDGLPPSSWMTGLTIDSTDSSLDMPSEDGGVPSSNHSLLVEI